MSLFRKVATSVEVATAAEVSQPVAVERNPRRNFVHEMALTAAHVAPLSGDTESELKRLATLHAQLLPVERDVKEQVEQRIEHLKAAQELPYKRLSLEPLSWRDKLGRPIFAIYRLDDPVCVIGSTFGWMLGRDNTSIPQTLRAKLEVNVKYDHFSSAYESRFSGLFPAEVRVGIAKAQPLFGEDLFVIAEANWVAVPRPKGDPLIVGWRAGALWLVAQFDTTDLESYFVSEFPA